MSFDSNEQLYELLDTAETRMLDFDNSLTRLKRKVDGLTEDEEHYVKKVRAIDNLKLTILKSLGINFLISGVGIGIGLGIDSLISDVSFKNLIPLFLTIYFSLFLNDMRKILKDCDYKNRHSIKEKLSEISDELKASKDELSTKYDEQLAQIENLKSQIIDFKVKTFYLNKKDNEYLNTMLAEIDVFLEEKRNNKEQELETIRKVYKI